MSEHEIDEFSMHYQTSRTPADKKYAKEMNDFFSSSLGSNIDKLRHFAKFVPRQELSIFLAKYEIFKSILDIQGHIIEGGVFLGGGLMTWANLSAIFEPVNHIRRIVGFDTFEGFPSLHHKDGKQKAIDFKREEGLSTNAPDDVNKAIELYDLNRPIGHIPRAVTIKGDATATMPQFIEENPHTVVAMLYLDFDAYEPTKIALETFLPRMPKGSVICFDELVDENWPGETLAVIETVGLKNLNIRRFPFVSNLSFAVLD